MASGVQVPGFVRVSLTSIQSSTPSTVGSDADAVVTVRPLLGENQTNSFAPWPFVLAACLTLILLFAVEVMA